MRVRRTLAALLAAPCLLTACGGGGSSVADPPVTGSPTSSAPTTKPPAHESPQHFIRRWAAAEKRMENTGKTNEYLAMSAGCRSCSKLASKVSRFYSAGGFVRWGGWRIVSIKRHQTKKRQAQFEVRLLSAATTYSQARGASPQHLDGGRSTELLTLSSTGDSWLVRSTAELAS